MTALLSAPECQLVLVDYQERLLPALSGAEAALANAVRLAEGARLLGVPVIATEENPTGLGPTSPRIRPACGRVIPKMAFDACAEGLLEALQVNVARRHVVLAGCEAHVCLLQTALGLLSRAWPVWVVQDACAARASTSHAAAMTRLASAGASLVTTEMVLFEWIRGAGHPRFVEVLRLIK